MGITELVLVAVGLSVDAFAVSVCRGLKTRRGRLGECLICGLFFGCFQALMPLIGFFLGIQFERAASAYGKWIAFVLLAFIGGKMIYGSLRRHNWKEKRAGNGDLAELLIMAVSTSIDALAAGVALALMPNAGIFFSAAVIGLTAFLMSAAGAAFGSELGRICKDRAGLAGGVILLGIGVKILLGR